ELYRNGYTNEDGQTFTGSEAVYEYWRDNETPDGFTGLVYRVLFEAALDPLTWAGGGGAVARKFARTGTRLRMAQSAGPARRVIGRAIEGGGNVLGDVLYTAEQIGDLGLGYAVDTIGWLWNKSPLSPAHATARRDAELAEGRRTVSTVVDRERRQPTQVVFGPNGQVITRTPVGTQNIGPGGQPAPTATGGVAPSGSTPSSTQQTTPGGSQASTSQQQTPRQQTEAPQQSAPTNVPDPQTPPTNVDTGAPVGTIQETPLHDTVLRRVAEEEDGWVMETRTVDGEVFQSDPMTLVEAWDAINRQLNSLGGSDVPM